MNSQEIIKSYQYVYAMPLIDITSGKTYILNIQLLFIAYLEEERYTAYEIFIFLFFDTWNIIFSII